MPVTVRNADILFNDGSTQSTAAGAPTTTQVLNATAAASAGAVGTYALLFRNNNALTSFGDTLAGSGLTPSDGGGGQRSGSVTGTWRCMGRSGSNYTGGSVTVWLRIS
jgi:hypothetical protein